MKKLSQKRKYTKAYFDYATLWKFDQQLPQKIL